jgi:hypothetical protein
VGDDLPHFKAMTYPELFGRMTGFVGQDDAEYMEYLNERYVSDLLD